MHRKAGRLSSACSQSSFPPRPMIRWWFNGKPLMVELIGTHTTRSTTTTNDGFGLQQQVRPPSTIKTIEPTPRGSSLNRAVVVENNPKTKLPQQDGFRKQQTQTPTNTTNKTPAGIQVLRCIAFVQSMDNFFTRAKRQMDFHRLLCVLIETPALVFISALVTLPVLRTSDLHDTHAPFP